MSWDTFDAFDSFDGESGAGSSYADAAALITASSVIAASLDLVFAVAEEAVRPSGGFPYPLDREHERSHISKSVRKIIKRVAKEQVDELVEQEETAKSQAAVQQLMTALTKADLQYKAFYAEILEQERQRLIDAEIKYLMGLKRMRDEEEEVLAVLMAMM